MKNNVKISRITLLGLMLLFPLISSSQGIVKRNSNANRGNTSTSVVSKQHPTKAKRTNTVSDNSTSVSEVPKDKPVTISNDGKPMGYINGHPYVDLGLSVKWAYCNIGAFDAEDYGEYFSWGEINQKNDYSKDTYLYQDTNIGENISSTKYDAAHTKWGGTWRMPTLAEVKELVSKCTYRRRNINGVWGFIFIGPNGNSIFLPECGRRMHNYIERRDNEGHYWTATQHESYPNSAYYIYFDFYGTCYWNKYRDKYDGRCIRAVSR